MIDIPPVEILGFIAGIFGSFCSVPQSIKIIKTKDASSVSMSTFTMLLIAYLLWLAYGLVIGSISLVFWNIIASILASTTLYLKITMGKREVA